jgi:hypothetical protein
MDFMTVYMPLVVKYIFALIIDKDLSYTVCVQSVSFKLSSDFQ